VGYFETLADAEKWADGVRGRYPNAIATIAPAALSRRPDSEAPAPQHADRESLSDTQVLKMLETRRASPAQDGVDEQDCAQIALLRPEDTSTRKALQEAVAQGAPVSFALQLLWSPQPIDLSRVPALAIFKAYTLYALESRREGRVRHFLRAGFFADPISAKQVAVQVRANFASAAVVPVGEEEVTRARAAVTGSSSIPYLAQPGVDRAPDADSLPSSATQSKPSNEKRRRVSAGPETLAQTLARLAAREIWTDPDSLSASGVRHLRVEVQEHTSDRSERAR
jgi:hypothetical protein